MSIKSQDKERLGEIIIYFWESLFYLLILKREFLENISLRGKRRNDPDLIYKLGWPHLRSSKLFACWNELAGN